MEGLTAEELRVIRDALLNLYEDMRAGDVHPWDWGHAHRGFDQLGRESHYAEVLEGLMEKPEFKP